MPCCMDGVASCRIRLKSGAASRLALGKGGVDTQAREQRGAAAVGQMR